MNKLIIVSILFSISILSVSAQVTVGSDVLPIEGALLDIKQNNGTDANATKGVVFPRVELQGRASLAPLAANTTANHKSHTGTVVYNLKAVTGANPLLVGLNVWDGTAWIPIGQQSSGPNFFYLPTFQLNISSTGSKTVDLYTDVYKKQFSPRPTNPNFNSSSGINFQIPGVYAAGDLHYAVLDYDATVIQVTGISAAGVLNYNVLSTTAPSASYITIVCVVK